MVLDLIECLTHRARDCYRETIPAKNCGQSGANVGLIINEKQTLEIRSKAVVAKHWRGGHLQKISPVFILFDTVHSVFTLEQTPHYLSESIF